MSLKSIWLIKEIISTQNQNNPEMLSWVRKYTDMNYRSNYVHFSQQKLNWEL